MRYATINSSPLPWRRRCRTNTIRLDGPIGLIVHAAYRRARRAGLDPYAARSVVWDTAFAASLCGEFFPGSDR